jgi:hypothetical protein
MQAGPAIAFGPTPWYHSPMTTVEILFRYAAQPTESVTLALASTHDVYGIRSLRFDQAAHTLRVEYDATRLNAAAVAKLVRQTGLEILEEQPPVPAPLPPKPATAN